MQIIYNLREILLGLFLTCYIGKLNAVAGFDIDLCSALAKSAESSHAAAKHHGVIAAHLFQELPTDKISNQHENNYRQYP